MQGVRADWFQNQEEVCFGWATAHRHQQGKVGMPQNAIKSEVYKCSITYTIVIITNFVFDAVVI